MSMDRAALTRLIADHVDDVLTDASFLPLPGYSRGKVRDSYDLDGERRLIITTDRQSAFDQILAAVPFKGVVLTQTARFWFEATKDIVPNHVVAHPDPNVLVARTLKMLPIEMVVRDYLTGTTATSIWTLYAAGDRYPYGVPLPDGMVRNQKLPATVVTPTTKGDAGAHDEPIGAAEIVASGLLSAEAWAEVEATALALFARGRELAARNNLILVDTKYELGFDANGTLTLGDEIHTPDSSRYWVADSYEQRFAEGLEPESLDKDFLRRWIIERCDPYREAIPPIPAETRIAFAERYVTLFETVTGQAFNPPPFDRPVADRLRANLAAYL